MLALCCHVVLLFSDETDYAFYSTNSTDNGDKTKAGKEAINPHIEIRKYANKHYVTPIYARRIFLLIKSALI